MTADTTDEPTAPPALPSVVLIPDDDFGNLAVCDWDVLVDNLNEGIPLDAAVLDASIDFIDIRAHDLGERVARVRALNATGNTAAYWGFDK